MINNVCGEYRFGTDIFKTWFKLNVLTDPVFSLRISDTYFVQSPTLRCADLRSGLQVVLGFRLSDQYALSCTIPDVRDCR